MIEATIIQKVMASFQDGMDLVFGFSIMYLYWIVKTKLSIQDVQQIFKELFEHQEEVMNLKFELLHEKISELKEGIKERDNHTSI